MACNISPRNRLVLAVTAQRLRCHTCCHSVAARDSAVAAVVTGFSAYLSTCCSVTTKSLLRAIKIKKNEKIGNIERVGVFREVCRESAATLPHSGFQNFVTNTKGGHA